MVVAYFHPMRVICPILSGRLSRANQGQWKSAKLSFTQNLWSRTDVLSVLSLHSSRTITPWGKPSDLWTFESTLLDQKLPIEYKLDVFIPPLTGTLLCRLWHSTTLVLDNLLGDLHSSLLQHKLMPDYVIPVLKSATRLLLCLQRSVSRSDNQPLQFCLSILETFTPLSKIYGTSNNWLNAKCLLIPFITVFLLTTTFSTKASFQPKPVLNF